MDYNDNEFQSQNLQLAGEGNTKFPPVLQPYALPKFDFDDSLHGHLRFDSLVETEVFLGIESNEDNQWIEEYSRGGIVFRTSAAESCSISRHNNVWSEATSSESVEMLLKSVGQEETIMRESDACDELGCVAKQMEPGPKHGDENLSKGGDVIDIQPMLPPDEILGNFSASKEDEGGGKPFVDASFQKNECEPFVDVSFQKNECESSVDGGLNDPVLDAVSGKGSLTLSKESYAIDQRKVDTSIESQNNRTEEYSSASGMQYDSVVTSAPNISESSGELIRQDAPHERNIISAVSKEDEGGGQPLVDASFKKNECESSVDVGLNDPVSDAVSGTRNLTLSKESYAVDQRKVDTSVESPNNRREDDSSASVMQFNSVVTSAPNICISSGEFIRQDAPYERIIISENIDVLQIEIGDQGHFVQGAETTYQNLDGNVADSGTPHLENPLCLASRMESLEEGNIIEATGKAGEPSSMLKEDTDLHGVEGCNENIQVAKCVNQVPLRDFEIGDTSKVNIHETLQVAFEGDNNIEIRGVEVGDANDSKASLLLLEENKPSKIEAVENSGSCGGGISTTNMEHSATQQPTKKPTDLTSKFVNYVSDVRVEDSNTEVNNDSSFAVAESEEVCEGNVVSRQSDVNCVAVDVKESTELPSDRSNMYQEFGKGSTENELLVSKSHSDATACNALALEDASLVSHDITGVILPSEDVAAANAAIIHQEVQMVDACNEESQCDAHEVVMNEVSQECVKEIDGCTVFSDSTKDVHGAEVQVISEKHEEVTMNENLGKASSKVSDAEPLQIETPAQPLPLEEIYGDADQNGQGDNESKLISGDKTSGQVAVPCIIGDALKIYEVPITSTHLSESDDKLPAPESGSIAACLDKSTCGSPIVIRATELSQSENEKQRVNGPTAQNNPAPEGIDGDANKIQSVSPDSKGNDASKGDKTFTFEVNPLADSSEKEAHKNWQPFLTIQATTVPLTVAGTPSTSGVRPSNSKIVHDASRENQVSDREIVRSVSKGTSERKTRRTSTKAAGKETAKKGKPMKDATSSRQSQKEDRTNNVSLSPSGIRQLVQSNEMQYVHVDGSMKPFVLTTSASALPDLNTSSPSMIQQPFTDLQQVQLRAQIFVYGALIQGTAPDEAYMISAFGGPDCGRSTWETAWRAFTERPHGQKSLLNNAETPLQSHSATRDQSTKHVAIPGKVSTLPHGLAISKGTPPIVNPIIPLSPPLWSIPTPSTDTVQSSGMPRSTVMDYQQALSPLHALQNPSIRNFVGHNTSWISQAPFRGSWVASPHTSGFDAGARLPGLPITETVHLTSSKELSVLHSSGVKHVSSGPMIQSASLATVFPVTSPVLGPKKMTPSPSQHSTEPKTRKRKKIQASLDFGQIMLQTQSQTEPVLAPIVSSHMSISVSIATPASLVSRASTEKVIMSVCPTTSADLLRGGNKEAQQRASLSEETFTKLKEAKIQAEDAAAFADAATSHSQEIWSQLHKQKNSGLVPDVESKLASAAVVIAAAAAVAKAAAAAANVASSAALQAKLMADEALDSSGCGNSGQINGASLSDSVKDMGNATLASILKGENAMSGSSSVIVAAREAARRQVVAASAASKKAENMDAIVKAAELAAAAVSQAGKIVALGDPLLLDELIEAGPESYWKVPQASTQLVATSNEVNNERLNMDGAGEGPDTFAKHSKKVPLQDNREIQTRNQEKFPTLRNISSDSFDNHARLADDISGSFVACGKNTKGHKGSKVSDLTKTIGVVPESEIGSRSPSISIQIEQERGAEPPEDNSIKEGSCVEVLKEGVRFKAGWFTANVSSLKDGKAYVCYNELPSDEEGLEKLKEWVALEGGDKAPKIRIARPVTVMPFKETRKRRRAAMGEYKWLVGDRVDAWMQNSWWEGVVTQKSKKDETMFTVHFPAQGQTSAVRAWHLRPSLIWKDGEWVEWSSSKENNRISHEDDIPHEKRLRLRSPAVEAKGKDKILKADSIVESGKLDEPTLLDLAVNEKMFNVGKSSRNENKPEALRMTRSGLQKEGSRVVFGVPKPGKKRKFMDVSKHYVADKGSKVSGSNDSVKFAKYLIPQSQGSGSRGWRNTLRTEPKEKRTAVFSPKIPKSGKQPTVSGRTIPQEDNSASSVVSVSDDGADIDHTAKIKDFVRHAENTSGKHDAMKFQSLSTSEGTADAPFLFSSMRTSSDAPSRKVSTSNPRRVTKGKIAPAGGKLNKIEEDYNGNPGKTTSEVVEPRRSNRRIQPTSRLLEGLQSSLSISKIPSVSHEQNQKSQNRSVSKGNNHG